MFAFTNTIQMTLKVFHEVAGEHTFASFKSYMRKMFLRAQELSRCERLCCAVNIIMAKWNCSAVVW